MNRIHKYWLNNHRVYLQLQLQRLVNISITISLIESSNSLRTKLTRWYDLPNLKSEQKHLEEREDNFRERLEKIEWKLRHDE